MKHIFSAMQETTALSRRRFSLGLLLRIIGLLSLFVGLLFLFSTHSPSPPSPSPPSPSASAFHQRPAAQAVTQQATVAPLHTDMVIVVDNTNQIQAHDPTSARFRGAQMFVNHAQVGDRIGIVRIPSVSHPSPVKVSDLTTIHNDNERSTLRHMLTQRFFGPVDPGPSAYFVPALQTASHMLLSAQDTNPKYLIMLTDSLAQSADQEPCPAASDQYHQWFCEIPKLKAQRISVIFYGYTTPDHQTEFQATRQYLQQHGGIALQVG
jgi:hypothetical protein